MWRVKGVENVQVEEKDVDKVEGKGVEKVEGNGKENVKVDEWV